MVRTFQSTPVISDGRALAKLSTRIGGVQFQSTPVISDGRARVTVFTQITTIMFQSMPVISDGRAGRQRTRVSIHARHF